MKARFQSSGLFSFRRMVARHLSRPHAGPPGQHQAALWHYLYSGGGFPAGTSVVERATRQEHHEKDPIMAQGCSHGKGLFT